MPNPNDDPPVVETPEQTVVEQTPTLPDTATPPDAVAQAKADAEKIKSEYEAKVKALEEEKEATTKRLKDAQAYISSTRRVDPETKPKPGKTFDEYLAEVSKTFEDDPKAGLQKVVRDFAADRELERQEYERRIQQAEEAAVRKLVALDPEKGVALREVEKLDEERPDLRNLTWEQKLEFVSMRRGATASRPATNGRVADVAREQDLAGGPAARAVPRSRQPAWLGDPEVLREAQGHFDSKAELEEWADPDKALARYQKSRARG